MKKSGQIYLLLSIFLLSFSLLVNAQEEVPKDTTIVQVETISVTEISGESEKLETEITEINRVLNDRRTIEGVDSILIEANVFLDSVVKVLSEEILTANTQALENKLTVWKSYNKKIDKWKEIMSNRLNNLDREQIRLDERILLWGNSRKKLIESESGDQIIQKLNDILDTLNQIKSDLGKEIDITVGFQERLSSFSRAISNEIDNINKAKSSLRTSFFYRDSPPLWSSTDSTSGLSFFASNTSDSISDNWRVIEVAVSSDSEVYYLTLLMFLIILLFFFIAYRNKKLFEGKEGIYYKHAGIIFSNMILSAFALTLTIFTVFNPDLPVIFREFLLILLLIPIITLLPKLLPKSLWFFIYVIFLLYFLNRFTIFISPTAFHSRIFLLIENLIAIWLFYNFLLPVRNKNIRNNPWVKQIIRITPIILLFLLVSFVGNALGYSRFARYLLNAIVSLSTIAVIIVLNIFILKSIILFFIELLDKFYESKVSDNAIAGIFKWIEIAGLILWIRGGLRTLGWYSSIMLWLSNVMELKWSVGSSDISIGGIILFVIIIVITFTIARLIKQLLASKNLLTDNLSRGIPSAISLVMRTVIVVFGTYVAISAAGVDLNKFGLIAGALGVGIGFGLQNVVFNFISGLIIAFERPINVGDIITVGELMGTVTEVGVRASKVITFDGSEVIVPNGNIISKDVINWTLSDQKRRLKIKIRTDVSADPRMVIKILKEEAGKHPNTLSNPQPSAYFKGYMDTSLDFTLYFWVYFNASLSTRSDVALAVHDALKINNITLHIPLHKLFYDPDRQAENDESGLLKKPPHDPDHTETADK